MAEQHRQAGRKKQKINAESTPINVESNNTTDVIEMAPLESQARKRPMGQKKAKEALRRGGGEACMEALEKMWTTKEAADMEKEKKKDERFMASLALEKERLQLEEKKVQAELQRVELDTTEKEEKIMSIDISSLSELQKVWYKDQQEKIVARRLSN